MSPESARPVVAGTSMPGFHRSRIRPGTGVAGGERLDRPSTSSDCGMPELAHRHVQGGRQRPAQRLVRPRLELAATPVGPDRRRPQGVEQHRLAHAAQSGEHDRALRTAVRHPFQGHVEGRELLVAAGQLGRALAGARRIRVPHGVHGSDCMRVSSAHPRLTDRAVCVSLVEAGLNPVAAVAAGWHGSAHGFPDQQLLHRRRRPLRPDPVVEGRPRGLPDDRRRPAPRRRGVRPRGSRRPLPAVPQGPGGQVGQEPHAHVPAAHRSDPRRGDRAAARPRRDAGQRPAQAAIAGGRCSPTPRETSSASSCAGPTCPPSCNRAPRLRWSHDDDVRGRVGCRAWWRPRLRGPQRHHRTGPRDPRDQQPSPALVVAARGGARRHAGDAGPARTGRQRRHRKVPTGSRGTPTTWRRCSTRSAWTGSRSSACRWVASSPSRCGTAIPNGSPA